MARFVPVQINRQITLAARPVGLPKISDFHLVYTPMPHPATGEVLFRSIYLSLDPHLRWKMNEDGPCCQSLALGERMSGGVVAQVVESEDPGFQTGDMVEGNLGWREYGVAAGGELRKIDPESAPISTALSVLGLPGLTAYFGLLDITEPQAGETVVVSGAAGGIGMLVGQIAKIRGCRVVGVAASEAKCIWLREELGFDEAFSFEAGVDLDARLTQHCPDGIDVYFDNVGGIVSDAALRRINSHARISLCGQSSQSSLEETDQGPRFLGRLIDREAKVQGFQISAYVDRFTEGLTQLRTWLQAGRLKYREEVAHGIEAAPQAFIGMLEGKSQGKQLVQLALP